MLSVFFTLSKPHFFIFHEIVKNDRKMLKNVFDQNFDENEFLRAKFNFSERPQTLKHQKISRQQ